MEAEQGPMEGMGRMKKYVFFDLDGTLIQSEFGIFESARYALQKLNIEESDDSTLRLMIGPPLYVSFRDLFGMDDNMAIEAVRLYREYYEETGLYKSPLYDGVMEALTELKNSGAVLAVVTGKPEDISIRILKYLKIFDMFDTVSGPDKKSTDPKKVDLILRAINALHIEKSDYENVIMVGDRHFDIEGAKEAGIASIGVLYGYGSREELVTAGADMIVNNVKELVEVIQ